MRAQRLAKRGSTTRRNCSNTFPETWRRYSRSERMSSMGAMSSSSAARAAAAQAARAALLDDIAPIDDIRSDREYRRRVSGNVLEQFLRVVDPRFAGR